MKGMIYFTYLLGVLCMFSSCSSLITASSLGSAPLQPSTEFSLSSTTPVHHNNRFMQLSAESQAFAKVAALTESLNSVALESLLQNPANGQIGIEVELQGTPRVLLYNPNLEKKTPKVAESIYSFMSYGQDIVATVNDQWVVSIDNERQPLSAVGPFPRWLKKNGEAAASRFPQEAGAKLRYWSEMFLRSELQGQRPTKDDFHAAWSILSDSGVGTDVAMEIITKPIDTDSWEDHEMVQVSLREFFKVLNYQATLPSEVNPGAADFNIASSNPLNTVTLRLLSSVTAQYNKALDKLVAQYPKIGAYKLKENLQIPNYCRTALNDGWTFVLAFPKNKAVTPSAPQVNIGIPVANFAFGTTANGKSILNIVGNSAPAPVPNAQFKHKYVADIWESIRTKAVSVVNGIILNRDKTKAPLVKMYANDLRGFFVTFFYYAFLNCYMNNQSKGVHNVLIKTPINDIVRALNPTAQQVLVDWWTKIIATNKLDETANGLFQRLDEIYKAGGLKAKGYQPVGTVTERVVLLRSVLKHLFKVWPAFPRYVGESAQPFTYGTSIDSRYGYDHPDSPSQLTPCGKPIPPFMIRGRLSVLVENRIGAALFNGRFTRYNQPWTQTEKQDFKSKGLDIAKNLQAPLTSVNPQPARFAQVEDSAAPAPYVPPAVPTTTTPTTKPAAGTQKPATTGAQPYFAPGAKQPAQTQQSTVSSAGGVVDSNTAADVLSAIPPDNLAATQSVPLPPVAATTATKPKGLAGSKASPALAKYLINLTNKDKRPQAADADIPTVTAA